MDDDAAVRNIARIVLERSGFTVLTAEDGRCALAVLDERRGTISAVLLDRTMPDMDGAETIAEIRRRGLDVPVVLSTGHGEEEEIPGLAGRLPKPYRPNDLVEALRRVVGGD